MGLQSQIPLGILLRIITDERVAPFSVSLLWNCVTVAICMLCAHGGSEHGGLAQKPQIV